MIKPSYWQAVQGNPPRAACISFTSGRAIVVKKAAATAEWLEMWGVA